MNRFRKYQPGGGLVVDINAPMITKESYLDSQRQAMIDAAYRKSLDRKLPAVPMISNPQSKEEFDRQRQTEIDRLLEMTEGDPDYLSQLDYWKNLTWNPLVEGYSCIYTFTDNYGPQYRCPSNYKFANMSDEDRAFIKIPLSDIRPGDGIMDGQSHMLMFDSFDENDGLPLYNYSDGYSGPSSIKIKGKYTWEQLDPRYHSAYRFVGNKEDNERWNAEYDQYRRNYINALNATLRNLPIFNLPQPVLEAPPIKLPLLKDK